MRTSLVPARRRALAVGLVILAALAAGIALFAACGGRVFVPIGPLLLSIRNPRNPTAIAALATLAAWSLAPEYVRGLGARAQVLAARVATPAALVVSLAVGFLAVQYGAFVAGGSDSFGYLSQARLWRTFTFERTHPLAPLVQWPDEALAFAPLGYRPAIVDGADVPIYPPGLPMAMALAQTIGGERAAFLVVPFCAAGTVVLGFLVGRRVGGLTTALFAGALIAVSPIFLFQAMQPMADVPAAFCWTLAFLLLQRGTPWATVAAGVAAGVAGLVRPNLWVVAATTMGLVAWWRPSGEPASRRVGWFVAGMLPPALVFLAWNVALYGSPFETGYGPAGDYLAATHVWPNARRYAAWLLELQGPLIFLGVAAPVAAALRPLDSARGAASDVRALASALAMVVVLHGFFLFYLVFDAWPALRFVLPTLPLLLVLVAVALARGLSLIPQPARSVAGFVLLVALVASGVQRATNIGVFHTAEDASRYERAATAAAARLPAEAVVFAKLHSGSVSYYTGRLIARWDAVPAGALAQYVRDLRAIGRLAYLVLDDLERPDFEPLHGVELASGPDMPAVWLVEPPVGVRLYDLSTMGGAALTPAPTPETGR